LASNRIDSTAMPVSGGRDSGFVNLTTVPFRDMRDDRIGSMLILET
jgi:hypothetical protein